MRSAIPSPYVVHICNLIEWKAWCLRSNRIFVQQVLEKCFIKTFSAFKNLDARRSSFEWLANLLFIKGVVIAKLKWEKLFKLEEPQKRSFLVGKWKLFVFFVKHGQDEIATLLSGSFRSVRQEELYAAEQIESEGKDWPEPYVLLNLIQFSYAQNISIRMNWAWGGIWR